MASHRDVRWEASSDECELEDGRPALASEARVDRHGQQEEVETDAEVIRTLEPVFRSSAEDAMPEVAQPRASSAPPRSPCSRWPCSAALLASHESQLPSALDSPRSDFRKRLSSARFGDPSGQAVPTVAQSSSTPSVQAKYISFSAYTGSPNTTQAKTARMFGFLRRKAMGPPAPALSGAPVIEGWLVKRSKYLRDWRPRWASLWRSGTRSHSLLVFSAEVEGYSQPTEVLDLRRFRDVFAVDPTHYGRSHCLVLECLTTTSLDAVTCRLVGLQFSSERERQCWLTAILRAMGPGPSGPRVLEEVR
mmetsp:Transcript_75065/g.223738  ORF Transcript_75065/g.223738 Transcript_75065/m.223738 type:complete len:306 (+) Transcript_75065:68-985(+)